MVSAHVVRGRRNLAVYTISLMRLIGMNAFQTLLLPACSGEEIKRLNHLDSKAIESAQVLRISGDSTGRKRNRASGTRRKAHDSGAICDFGRIRDTV